MDTAMQAKLLKALEEQKVRRIGGREDIHFDVRIVCASNEDPEALVEQGRLRSDFYYRIGVVRLRLPPLRERPEDIPELIEHFLRIYGHKYQRAITLSTGAMNILKNYRWPGNVRELENALEYLTLCCPDGDTIPEELVLDLLRQSAPDTADQPVSNLSDAVALYERTLIERALRDSKSMRAAAEALGVNVSTISRKIKQYHIELS